MFLKNSFFVLLLSCLFACQQPQNSSIPDSSLAIEVDSSTVVLLSEFKAFEKILAQEKGKAVLVNLWATWCKPCVNEMPLLEKLHQNYKDKGIKVITLSMDEVTKIDSLVIPYWQAMNFSMDNYLIAAEDPGALVNQIDPLWLGLLPTTFIFNTNGEKVETVTGTMSYGGFEKKMLNVLNNVN